MVVEVRKGEQDRSFAATVEPIFADARSATSYAEGIVTRVEVAAGQVLDSGSPVLQVDGAAIIAYRAPVPFYRELSTAAGDGADTLALQQLLVTLGYLQPEDVDGKFGFKTRSAVEAMNKANGFSGRRSMFGPENVVWIGPDPFVVGDVRVEAGRMLTAGTEVVATARPLTRLRVVEPDAAPAPGSENWAVIFRETSFPYDRRSGIVEGDARLATLGQTMDGDESPLAARVINLDPLQIQIVPGTAIVLTASGATCVFMPTGTSFTSQQVVVVGGALGVVELLAEPKIDKVLANPAVQEDAACD